MSPGFWMWFAFDLAALHQKMRCSKCKAWVCVNIAPNYHDEWALVRTS